MIELLVLVVLLPGGSGRESSLGRVGQVLAEAFAQGFESALLRRRQVGGQGEGAQVCEQVLELVQACFDLGCPWGQDGGWLRVEGALGIFQEGLSIGGVRSPIGVNEKNRVPGLQRLGLQGAEESILVLLRQGRQCGC
jgi:hypothetical protein